LLRFFILFISSISYIQKHLIDIILVIVKI